MDSNDGRKRLKFKCIDPNATEAIRFLNSNEGDYDPATPRFHIAGLKDGESIAFDIEHVVPKGHFSLKPENILLISKIEAELLAQKADKIKIERAPGFGLRDFLGHFCEPDFREETLEAQHADGIAYYEQLLASGQTRRANIVRYMIYVWLLRTAFGGVISLLLSKVSIKIGGDR